MPEKRTCGDCTLCCKILSVLDLEKPPMTWCEHCDIGKGCRIYDQRPESCQAFNCMWLINEWMPDEMRPDRCKIVFESLYGTKVILAMLNEGADNAHERQPVAALIEHLVARLGHSVVVVPYPSPPRDPIVCISAGQDPADVFAAIDWTADENLKRYAAQEGISLEQAEKQQLAMVTTTAMKRIG